MRQYVDDELGVGSGCAHVIPVLGNGVGRQLEVDGRNGSDGVNAQRLGMTGQLLRIGGIVAGNVSDDGQLAASLFHHIFQHQLTLGNALVDALAGGATDIQTLHALLDEPTGQFTDGSGVDLALLIVAGIESRDNTLILLDEVIKNFYCIHRLLQ